MDTYTFEELIKTYPDDKVLRFAYADHLEEEGNTRLANNIRVILELGLKPADCTFHKNFPAWCWFNKETSRCGWEIELNDILKVNSDNSRITHNLGEFKAENTEEAEMLAIENSDISFCHQCSSHCEDAQIEDIYTEEVQ
jgi:uncharacterized protein (TIGR02996 family)